MTAETEKRHLQDSLLHQLRSCCGNTRKLPSLSWSGMSSLPMKGGRDGGWGSSTAFRLGIEQGRFHGQQTAKHTLLGGHLQTKSASHTDRLNLPGTGLHCSTKQLHRENICESVSLFLLVHPDWNTVKAQTKQAWLSQAGGR